ncbi:MAG: CinA family protein [Pseudomonadota bacterium]
MSDAAAIAERLIARREWLAVAESCTGGLFAAACTDLAGSSAWFERGLTTYSNRAKQELLGVPASLLAAHGAVSEPCVRAMAEGLMARAPVQHAVAVSGIAGPGGGTADKPVGTVWIAWAGSTGVRTRRFAFAGDRQAVREQAVTAVFAGLVEQLLPPD